MKHLSIAAGLILIGCLVLLPGCAKPHAAVGSPPPRELNIMLRMMSSDHRLTLFEISKKGDLYYAGGHDVLFGQASLVGPLPPTLMRQIWHIITDDHLLEAPSAARFAKGERVTYELMIDTGSGRRTLRALDDQAPGVKDIQDLLMKYQASLRYDLKDME